MQSIYHTLLDFHPFNVHRPLDWRWRLASALAQPGVRVRRRWLQDVWLQRATWFHRVAHRSGGPFSARSRKRDPEIVAAVELRERVDRAIRIELESALLAGESYDEVADRVGVESGIIEAYEQLHFAVIDRLDARAHLVFRAMPGLHLDASGPDDETLVKLFAYFQGPAMLDLVLPVLGIRPARPGQEFTPSLSRAVELMLAAKRLRVTARNVPGLLALAELERDLRRRRPARFSPFVEPHFDLSGVVRDEDHLSTSGAGETGPDRLVERAIGA